MIPFGEIGTVIEIAAGQYRGRAQFPSGVVLPFKFNELRYGPSAGRAAGATVGGQDLASYQPGFGVGSQLRCVRADQFEIV
jgi:hypothetical protein